MFKKKIDFHKELLIQLEQLLRIEVGSYIYEKGKDLNLMPWIETQNGGIDFYIHDPEFTVIKKNKKFDYLDFKDYFWVDEIFGIDDMLLIGHYHYEDLLYLILNFDSEKEKMIKLIDNYIEWRSFGERNII